MCIQGRGFDKAEATDLLVRLKLDSKKTARSGTLSGTISEGEK